MFAFMVQLNGVEVDASVVNPLRRPPVSSVNLA